MAANLVATSGIITADTPPDENWSMQDPAVAALSNGNYVVAWKAEPAGGSPRDIYFQIYDADGNEVSGVQEIGADPGDFWPNQPMERPQIVGLADGGFVLTYQDGTEDTAESPGGLFIKLKVRLYDSSGSLLSEDTPSTSYGRSDVAALDDGGYVAIWRNIANSGATFARRYDASGNIVETTPMLNGGTDMVAVTGVAGGYMVAYDSVSDGDGDGILARIVTGGVPGPEFLINTTTVGHQEFGDTNHNAATLADGNFVVAWHQMSAPFDFNASEVRAQIFTAAGVKVGGEIIVNTPADGFQGNPEVTALSGGGFLVTWQDSGVGFGRAQMFDAAGNKVGGVADLPGGSPAVAQLVDGEVVFAFKPFDGLIKSQVFGIVEPLSAVDDHWYVSRGTNAMLPPLAALGNDEGSGTLSLTGVANAVNGAVSLDPFGAILFGTTNDPAATTASFTYTVTDGATSDEGMVTATLVSTDKKKNVVVVSTAANEVSYIDGKEAADTLTGGDGYDALLGGAANDKLLGMGANDFLFGGDGTDVLDGGDGIDFMQGGAGNDTYTVNDPLDIVDETGGSGIDTVRSTAATFTLGDGLEKLLLLGVATDHLNGFGNALANTITGNNGVNVLMGFGGSDVLTGKGGGDTMDGGEDGDTYVTEGPDIIHDTGTSGVDKVVTASPNFVLGSGTGIENIEAAAGTANVKITADDAANKLTGNDGNNTLKGMGNNDTLLGGLGNDILEGGAGLDTSTGGAGSDTFVFKTGDSPSGGPLTSDMITDFVTGVDKIDLDTIGIGGLPLAGYAETTSASATFSAVSSAAAAAMASGTVSVVFVAGPTIGWLFWNTDGNMTTAEQFARFTGLNSTAHFGHGDLM